MTDLALVLLLAVIPLVGRALGADSRSPFVAAELVSVALAVMLFPARHRYPLGTLVVGLTAAVAMSAWVARPTALLPIVIALLFSAAVRVGRRTALVAGGATVAATYAIATISLQQPAFGAAALASLAWPGLAVAAGDAVRHRRAYIVAVEERADRAEQTREEEARRQVAEERLRIARELHDVVAHRIVVIKVQAEVAAHMLRIDPNGADDALAEVRSSAGTVLDELGGMLGVLRNPGDADAPLEPSPTLDELPSLVDSFVSAGLRVRWKSSGSPRPLSEPAQLAAYRLVQEGLTNAQRHGDGSARLRTTYHDGHLEIAIENACDRTRQVSAGVGGRGLVGMRERVVAADGTLEIGTAPDGMFKIVAELPVSAEEQR